MSQPDVDRLAMMELRERSAQAQARARVARGGGLTAPRRALLFAVAASLAAKGGRKRNSAARAAEMPPGTGATPGTPVAALPVDKGGDKVRESDPANLSDKDKQRMKALFQKAVSVSTVQEEEATWTEMVDSFESVPEVEALALSNRGNSRSRQGKFKEALSDYSRSIGLSPGQADAYLNRGIVYEAQGKFEAALDDYAQVLRIDPNDPAGWNNRGNALLAVSRFAEARDAFRKALDNAKADSYAFAQVNLFLAEHQLGNDEVAFRGVGGLLRKYADAFPDARAFFALMLWDRGERVRAEEEWDRATASDARYRSLEWVSAYRRWPPRLQQILKRFSETSPLKAK